MHSHTEHSVLDMRLPLLLVTFFAIAHADGYTAYAPAPSLVEDMYPPPSPPPPTPSPPPPAFPPPPPTPSPPPPAWSPASPPPPPPSSSKPLSPPRPAPAVWTPVPDVNFKAIRQVGQFAVRIYGLVKRVELIFLNVISCKTQPSNGGYIYQLKIAVHGSGAKSPRYDAVVWGILGTTRWELRSFNAAK